MQRIDELFIAYPFYGSRQMQAALALEGMAAGRHRVRRLMSLMGLQAIYQQPKMLSATGPTLITPEDLIQPLTVTRLLWPTGLQKNRNLRHK